MHIDQFGVLAALGGSAVGGMYAAISTEGTKARILWFLAAGFAVATVAFWFRPASITAEQVWNYVIALTPLTSVVFVMLTREPPAPKQPVKKPDAIPLTHTTEGPDMKLAVALQQVAQSTWAKSNNATPEAVLIEFRDKLATHKLTAFGRREAGAIIEPIPWRNWHGLQVSPSKHAAVTDAGQVIYHDLQFDSAFVDGLWPTSTSWMRY